jgi:hypothetical protein
MINFRGNLGVSLNQVLKRILYSPGILSRITFESGGKIPNSEIYGNEKLCHYLHNALESYRYQALFVFRNNAQNL